MLNPVVTTREEKRKLVVSPSSLALWRECRRKFKLKYLDGLIPETWEDGEPLSFGRLVDRALERVHDGVGWLSVNAWMDSEFAGESDPKLLERFTRTQALLRGYVNRWSETDPWQYVGVQVHFEGPVTNPATQAEAKLTAFNGWLDALILWNGELWVYELKTASRIDGAYLEALWQAPQTGLYALYVQRTLGVPVAGVLYDICQKSSPQTVRRVGESQDEFEARARELASLNKSGKTAAKRQMPETWKEYGLRLLEQHSKPEMYRREAIPITAERLAEVEADLWLQAKDMTTSRQQGTFYKNERACVAWGQECEYLPLCRSGMSPIVRDNLYRKRGEAPKPIENDLHDLQATAAVLATA